MKAISLLSALVVTLTLFSFNNNFSSDYRLDYKDSLEADRKKWMDEVFQSIKGMYNMRQQINGVILPKITGKDYFKNPKVSCITCHRGEAIPSVH